MNPTILFLFNSSDYAPAPWLADGRFNCVSVDYNETDHETGVRPKGDSERHYRINLDLSCPTETMPLTLACLIECMLEEKGLAAPSFVVSFAPCTDLSVAGAKHFKAKLARDPEIQEKAVRMAQLASHFGCPYVVENPVSRLATLWRKPDVYVDPCAFQDMFEHYAIAEEHPEFPDIIPPRDLYTKKTGLWLGHGANPPHTDYHPVSTDGMVFPGWEKLGGKSARTKYIRSLTPRGLSYGLFHSNVFLALHGSENNCLTSAALAHMLSTQSQEAAQ